jgi:hypothetical protein
MWRSDGAMRAALTAMRALGVDTVESDPSHPLGYRPATRSLVAAERRSARSVSAATAARWARLESIERELNRDGRCPRPPVRGIADVRRRLAEIEVDLKLAPRASPSLAPAGVGRRWNPFSRESQLYDRSEWLS